MENFTANTRISVPELSRTGPSSHQWRSLRARLSTAIAVRMPTSVLSIFFLLPQRCTAMMTIALSVTVAPIVGSPTHIYNAVVIPPRAAQVLRLTYRRETWYYSMPSSRQL